MRRTLLLLAAAFAWTACKVEASVDVSMKPDGSGAITLTVVADAELVSKAPNLATDLRFEDATAAGWVLDGPTPTDTGGLQVVLTHDFDTVEEATALLRSLNGSSGPLQSVTITRSVTEKEVTTVLSGGLRVDGGVGAFADPDVLTAVGGVPYADAIAATGLGPNDVITFRLTTDLPGDATSLGTGSAVDGSNDALTWTVPMDGTAVDLSSLFVVKQGTPDSGWGTLSKIAFGALAVWVLLAGAFILFVVNARRQRAAMRSRAAGRWR